MGYDTTQYDTTQQTFACSNLVNFPEMSTSCCFSSYVSILY